MKKVLFVFLVLGLTLTACASEATLEITDVWARPGLKDGNSGVFFLINNQTKSEVKLISADSEISAFVEVHKSYMEDEVMKMEKQEFVTVSAESELSFKPGSYHIMLIGLKNDLTVGTEFEVTLNFEDQESQTVNVVVTEP